MSALAARLSAATGGAARASSRMLHMAARGSVVRTAGVFTPSHSAPGGSVGGVRHLNLHEYQAKDLLESHSIQVQKGKMAASPEEALTVASWIKEENPEAELILKAQIHAGGRGKGTFNNGFKGGVQICTTADEVADLSSKMFGAALITKQTGPDGQMCQKVLINEGISIEKEYYFAILMDRAYGGPVVVASTEGGMDIEDVAANNPGAIVTQPVPIGTGMTDDIARTIGESLGFSGDRLAEAMEQFKNIYQLFIDTDATQVEINPLAIGSVPGGIQSRLFAVDAKFNFDDNAAFRQAALFDMRDKTMEDARDVAAEEVGLNYIGLDGNIGCMVNGAGLAMATMDIIKLHGGSPANFLDVGGGATAAQVTEAFKIITADPSVKGLLVNIFGGIMKCDTIAEGIVTAAKEVGLEIPLVVRLEGTNVEIGKKILETSGLPIITADDLDDAAKKAVAAV